MPMVCEKWLKCRIDKGMFSDELAVTYPSHGPWQKSVFVPAYQVRGEIGEPGKVRVSMVEGAARLMAVLPSSQRDVVVVADGDLTD